MDLFLIAVPAACCMVRTSSFVLLVLLVNAVLSNFTERAGVWAFIFSSFSFAPLYGLLVWILHGYMLFSFLSSFGVTHRQFEYMYNILSRSRITFLVIQMRYTADYRSGESSLLKVFVLSKNTRINTHHFLTCF